MGKFIDKIYRSIGDGGTALLIFASGVVVHTLLSFRMEMIYDAYGDFGEFGAAAWAAFFTGRNWNGVTSHIGQYYGYLGSALYAPVMVLVRNAVSAYRVILIINGVIASITPAVIYKISAKLGIEKAWMRVLAALVCGFYPAAFAGTKFIRGEIFCYLFPWLIILIIIRAYDIKKRFPKHVMSVLCAFVITAGVMAHERLAFTVPAAVLAVVYARFFLKKRTLPLVSFLPALGVMLSGGFVLSRFLSEYVWGYPPQNPLSGLSALKADGILRTAAGHLYYIATSTWGLGVLAVCFFFTVLSARRARVKPDSAAEAIDLSDVLSEEKFLIFSVFSTLSVFFNFTASVADNAAGYAASPYQDAVMSGRLTDAVIPLLLLIALWFVFKRGVELKHILSAVVATGVIYAAFLLLEGGRVASLDKLRVDRAVGLFPLRLGENIEAPVTLEGFFLTISAVFSFMALLIVFVCCSKKRRALITSLVVLTVTLYGCAAITSVYLPYAAEQERLLNAPVYRISGYLYNSEDAPPIIAVGLNDRTVALLQYLNRDSVLRFADGEIPVNSLVVTVAANPFPFNNAVETEKLGETSGYIIWAYGEKAVAYAQSQEE